MNSFFVIAIYSMNLIILFTYTYIYVYLLLKFIRGSQDQVTFLRSWEKYLNTRNAKLLSKAALLFKAFYDKDYVEEDSVMEWYSQAKDTSDVKRRCAVFVEWLKNAEEED